MKSGKVKFWLRPISPTETLVSGFEDFVCRNGKKIFIYIATPLPFESLILYNTKNENDLNRWYCKVYHNFNFLDCDLVVDFDCNPTN